MVCLYKKRHSRPAVTLYFIKSKSFRVSLEPYTDAEEEVTGLAVNLFAKVAEAILVADLQREDVPRCADTALPTDVTGIGNFHIVI